MARDCEISNQSIILKGGTLIDGTGSPPLPNSIIILTGGKITEVGSVGEISVPKYSKIIDIQGKTVIPSFIDSHTHFLLMGERILMILNLSMTKSLSEIIDRVKARIIELPKGVWLTEHGWDESTWTEKRYPQFYILKTSSDQELLETDEFDNGELVILEKFHYLLRYNIHHIGELNKALRDWQCERIQ